MKKLSRLFGVSLFASVLTASLFFWASPSSRAWLKRRLRGLATHTNGETQNSSGPEDISWPLSTQPLKRRWRTRWGGEPTVYRTRMEMMGSWPMRSSVPEAQRGVTESSATPASSAKEQPPVPSPSSSGSTKPECTHIVEAWYEDGEGDLRCIGCGAVVRPAR